jgi:hypothetical protein
MSPAKLVAEFDQTATVPPLPAAPALALNTEPASIVVCWAARMSLAPWKSPPTRIAPPPVPPFAYTRLEVSDTALSAVIMTEPPWPVFPFAATFA